MKLFIAARAESDGRRIKRSDTLRSVLLWAGCTLLSPQAFALHGLSVLVGPDKRVGAE